MEIGTLWVHDDEYVLTEETMSDKTGVEPEIVKVRGHHAAKESRHAVIGDKYTYNLKH